MSLDWRGEPANQSYIYCYSRRRVYPFTRVKRFSLGVASIHRLSRRRSRKRLGSLPHVRHGLDVLRLHERQEIVDPILRLAHRTSQGRSSMPLTHIPEEQWEEVVRRNASGESLRQLAKVYGVSHETVRQLVKRITAEICVESV
jgi:DNA-directed RNA polymerase specialized sigma24 family protein